MRGMTPLERRKLKKKLNKKRRKEKMDELQRSCLEIQVNHGAELAT